MQFDTTSMLGCAQTRCSLLTILGANELDDDSALNRRKWGQRNTHVRVGMERVVTAHTSNWKRQLTAYFTLDMHMDTDAWRVRPGHLMGADATYPQATLAALPALLLLIAGNDHAASLRLATHPARAICGYVQLKFQGSNLKTDPVRRRRIEQDSPPGNGLPAAPPASQTLALL
jgi:hypothetical protein